MMKGYRYASITFGLGGYHAEAGNCTLSGHSGPEQWEKGLTDEEKAQEFAGAFVLDIRELVTHKPALGIICPMHKPTLKPGEVDRYGERVDLSDTISQAITRELCKHSPAARVAIATYKLGSLDQVATDIYVDWWRGHGARVGRVDGHKITWEGADHAAS